MGKFTDEQMIEICAARERLRAIRDEIQSYPASPEEQPESMAVEPDFNNRQWDTIQQLRAEMIHIRKKWHDHLEEDRQYRAKKKPAKAPF